MANQYRTEQVTNYYSYHPDAVTLTIVATGREVSGLFDDSFMSENSDRGNVKQLKKYKHFHCPIAEDTYFTARSTQVTVDSQTYTVWSKERHATEGIIELWLV